MNNKFKLLADSIDFSTEPGNLPDKLKRQQFERKVRETEPIYRVNLGRIFVSVYKYQNKLYYYYEGPGVKRMTDRLKTLPLSSQIKDHIEQRVSLSLKG